MTPDLAPLLHRLRGIANLSDGEEAVVDALRHQPVLEFAPREVAQGEGQPAPSLALLSGWACRARLLSDGRRQILDFLLPGDLAAPLLPRMPAPGVVLALAPLRLVDATPLFQAIAPPARHPALARALRAMAWQDEARLRSQIVRLGRQTAYERLASLLLELDERLAAAGLTDGGGFTMPLTQDMLGDALGLSAVHVNRTLQQMRRDGLVDMRGKLVVLRQVAELRRLADWQPLLHPAEQATTQDDGSCPASL